MPPQSCLTSRTGGGPAPRRPRRSSPSAATGPASYPIRQSPAMPNQMPNGLLAIASIQRVGIHRRPIHQANAAVPAEAGTARRPCTAGALIDEAWFHRIGSPSFVGNVRVHSDIGCGSPVRSESRMANVAALVSASDSRGIGEGFPSRTARRNASTSSRCPLPGNLSVRRLPAA